jgi:hypothetical protein
LRWSAARHSDEVRSSIVAYQPSMSPYSFRDASIRRATVIRRVEARAWAFQNPISRFSAVFQSGAAAMRRSALMMKAAR